MKKFIVIYHAPASATQQTANLSPADQAKGMEGWMRWAERTGKKLLDLGAPLVNGQRLGYDGATANSNKDVTGYSVIEAETMDDAKAILKGHPHLLHPEASIEVHETMPIPGM